MDERVDENNSLKLYKQLVPNENYGKIVKRLLIKIQFINQHSFDINIGQYSITTINKSEMENEVNIQTDIFFKTLKYMQPLCPSIVYADIITNYIEKLEILNLLKFANNGTFLSPDFSLGSIIFTNDVGIIAMELINKSMTLTDYMDQTNNDIIKLQKYIYAQQKMDKIEKIEKIENANTKLKLKLENIDLIKNICRYALLKLALDTGYNHNDFHTSNILVQVDYTYFKNIRVSPIIIDFGRTKKISLNILDDIKTCVKEKKYIEALSYLCKPDNNNKIVSNIEHIKYYGWVCGDYHGEIPSNALPENVNIQMDDLFMQRELSIDDNIKIMENLHKSQPDKYPLLPLSNNIKNLLYNGIIDGGSKKKYKRKTLRLMKNKNKNKDKRKTLRI